MMDGPEKSDLAIVAGKPANKAKQSAAESVERRAGTKGNAGQQSTFRTQSRANVSQALERIRQALAVTHPRWEPYAGKPPVRICAGAVTGVPTATAASSSGCSAVRRLDGRSRRAQQHKMLRVGFVGMQPREALKFPPADGRTWLSRRPKVYLRLHPNTECRWL